VLIDSPAAFHLLQSLAEHPYHQYMETSPALTTSPFDALVPHFTGYRQVPGATRLHLARVHGIKLITFDRAVAVVWPWNERLE
jgi:hypothetical protein